MEKKTTLLHALFSKTRLKKKLPIVKKIISISFPVFVYFGGQEQMSSFWPIKVMTYACHGSWNHTPISFSNYVEKSLCEKKITNPQWLLLLVYSLWFYKKLKRCPLMTLVNCIFENEWVFMVPEGYLSAQSSDLCSYPLNLWKLKHRLFNKRGKICLDRYNVDAWHQKV